MYKMTEIKKRFILTVMRTNNGKIKLDTPIKNIKCLKITDIIFNHGPKKQGKRRKRRDCSEDSDERYENGNLDLIDSTWIIMNIEGFPRGIFYDHRGALHHTYTKRIATSDIDFDECTGEGSWGENTIDYDWYAPNDTDLQTISDINIDVITNSDLNPVQLNFNLEIEIIQVL